MRTVYFDSRGESGNIFAVVSLVKSRLTKTEYKDLVNNILNSASYEEALSHVREYVDLVDISGEY